MKPTQLETISARINQIMIQLARLDLLRDITTGAEDGSPFVTFLQEEIVHYKELLSELHCADLDEQGKFVLFHSRTHSVLEWLKGVLGDVCKQSELRVSLEKELATLRQKKETMTKSQHPMNRLA